MINAGLIHLQQHPSGLPVINNSALILSELQSHRNDFNEYARTTGERLASLETSMRAISGNGQPGRLGVLESAVTKIQRWQWRATGIGAAALFVVDLVMRILKI